jgi:S1-C subfamily serine protease
MNIAPSMLSKMPKPMRFYSTLILFAIATAFQLHAAPSEAPSSIPPEAAEAGKDQVHALNNAFARVFETVAPSVVIIEVSKKSDGSENSAFDDLFFQGPPDENNPDSSLPISTWSKARTKSA